MTSCDKSSNSSNCGAFWYSDFNKETVGHDYANWDNYVNYFTQDGIFCVHLIKHLPFDKNSYYTGQASLKNDTMYIDLNNELIISLKTTKEVSPKLRLCNLYFTSKTIPNAIYWGDKQIIKTGPTFIDL
jgi:hypothetical protein